MGCKIASISKPGLLPQQFKRNPLGANQTRPTGRDYLVRSKNGFKHRTGKSSSPWMYQKTWSPEKTSKQMVFHIFDRQYSCENNACFLERAVSVMVYCHFSSALFLRKYCHVFCISNVGPRLPLPRGRGVL